MKSKKRKRNATISLTEAQQKHFQFAFETFDIHHTGTMREPVVMEVLQALGFKCTTEDIHPLFIQLDTGKEGTIDREGFFQVVKTIMAEHDGEKVMAEQMFNMFDRGSKGVITLRDLKEIAQELGEEMSEKELQKMLDIADKDEDGQVQFDDFVATLRSAGDK